MVFGELKKMKLTGYRRNTFQAADRTGDEYTAVVNPETYTLNYEILSNKEQASGTSANQSNFNRIAPRRLEFEFLFDATGALTESPIALPLSVGNQTSVDEQVRQFKKTIFDFLGDTHQPPFVMLQWGTLEFKCKVERLQIAYKLFKPDGSPLRAVATVTFTEEVEDERRVAEEDATSPDLTHIRTVREGDTLPLLCFDIYGNSALYREVARVNRLINFRQLVAGQKIFFPPINDD